MQVEVPLSGVLGNFIIWVNLPFHVSQHSTLQVCFPSPSPLLCAANAAVWLCCVRSC